jgi:glycosyltransferase involved in cell wall biosynthesis
MCESVKGLVSFIVPVYNGQEYLEESINSILTQTYSNLEIIIINDGSVDGSDKILQAIKDPRVIYIKQDNQGLAATLNTGIHLSRGEYIARQDQDDISVPNRIETQIIFSNKLGADFVGTRSTVKNKEGDKVAEHNHPLSNMAIRLFLQFDNPFVHSSILCKRHLLVENLYSLDVARQPPEDYELWSRLSDNVDMVNLPNKFITYRQLASGMSQSNKKSFGTKVIRISAENISRVMSRSNPNLIYQLSSLYHRQSKPTTGTFFKLLVLHLLLAIKIYDLKSDSSFEYLKVYFYQLFKLSRNFLLQNE